MKKFQQDWQQYKKDGKLYPIECKWKEKPDSSDIRGLLSFMDHYPADEVGPAAIACSSPLPFQVILGIQALPGWSYAGEPFESSPPVIGPDSVKKILGDLTSRLPR